MQLNNKILSSIIFKRILFLCFLSLWFTQNTKAQDLNEAQSLIRKIRWGLMLGLNHAQVDLSKSKLPEGLKFEKSNDEGGAFGIRGRIPISNKFSLQTGINFHIYLFQLTQTTFGTDTLTGFITKQPMVKSWEVPVTLSYNLPFKNNLLKNIYVAGGMGFALDHYSRISETTIVQDPGKRNIYDYYNGRSETRNNFVPNLIAGIGTDVNLFARRKMQLNIWYSQGLKQQGQLNTDTILDGKVNYPWEINAVVSSFRYELVYFP